MKKQINISLFLLSILLVVTISCQKDSSSTPSEQLLSAKSLTSKMVISVNQKNILIEWLNLHDYGLNTEQKKIFENIISNLEFSSITIEKRRNGENLIIIPINNEVRKNLSFKEKYLQFNEKTIFNLMIVQNSSGKLRWSSVVAYLPAHEVSLKQLPEKTIQNIINGDRVGEDGIYKFINLKGRLQYQLEYRSGRLVALGKPTREDYLIRNKLRNNTLKNIESSGQCLNWYLVTTWYNPDGSTEVEEEYLFTTCDNDEDNEDDNGGSSNGGNSNPQDPQNPEEPNDQEIIVTGSEDVYESDYADSDYQLPIETEVPGEMDLDEEGNPYPPNPLAASYYFHYTWAYSRKIVGPVTFNWVKCNDATVHPANITYISSIGKITRDITLLAHNNHEEILGANTAKLTWSFIASVRTTNHTTNVTEVKPRNKFHQKTITF